LSKLESVLNKLQKVHGENFSDVKKTGTIKRVFLSSPRLNFAFGGGFGMGRIYEFSGPESGGKTTLATYIGGEIQKKNDRNIVVFVDMERSFDETFANRLGISTDTDKDFIFLRPVDGESGFDVLKDLIADLPIGLIIWDSIAVTPSRGQVQDAFKASFGGTASVFALGLKSINPLLSKYETSMIMINQERANMSMFGADFQTTGGYAPKYYSSWRARITRIDTIKTKGIASGIVNKVRNIKNKIGIPFREAELHLDFDEGFNSDFEYLTFLVDLGIVEKRGAWYYQEEWDFKGQGKDSIKEFLDENPKIFEQVKNTVNVMLSGATVLDDDNVEPGEEEVGEEEVSEE